MHCVFPFTKHFHIDWTIVRVKIENLIWIWKRKVNERLRVIWEERWLPSTLQTTGLGGWGWQREFRCCHLRDHKYVGMGRGMKRGDDNYRFEYGEFPMLWGHPDDVGERMSFLAKPSTTSTSRLNSNITSASKCPPSGLLGLS